MQGSNSKHTQYKHPSDARCTHCLTYERWRVCCCGDVTIFVEMSLQPLRSWHRAKCCASGVVLLRHPPAAMARIHCAAVYMRCIAVVCFLGVVTSLPSATSVLTVPPSGLQACTQPNMRPTNPKYAPLSTICRGSAWVGVVCLHPIDRGRASCRACVRVAVRHVSVCEDSRPPR